MKRKPKTTKPKINFSHSVATATPEETQNPCSQDNFPEFTNILDAHPPLTPEMGRMLEQWKTIQHRHKG